jgi:pimeloyl-ACP methyl ester carboxylesterase
MKIILLFSFFCNYIICFCQDTCYYSIKYGETENAGKYAFVNGIKMYYETYGNPVKQTLLLIHGNGGDIFAERCQIEYFRDRYYVIAADSRFHGKTEDGSEPLTYDLMAKDMNELLDQLKIDSAYIIGQSDGAIIGLLLAINYPAKVSKLVATSPNLRTDSTAMPGWWISYLKEELEKAEMKIKGNNSSPILLREWTYLNLMDKYPDISNEELSKIQAKVLIMAGDGDMIKLEHILEIYQNIPNAQLFIMPGATHFMLREEYSLFNQIVGCFLDNSFKRPSTRDLLDK